MCLKILNVICEFVITGQEVGETAMRWAMSSTYGGSVIITDHVVRGVGRVAGRFLLHYRPVFHHLPEPNRAWLLVVYFLR